MIKNYNDERNERNVKIGDDVRYKIYGKIKISR